MSGSLSGGGADQPSSPTSRNAPSVGSGKWVAEGREYAKGVRTDNTRWNQVLVSGSLYTVERAAQLQAKINLDEIIFTPAFERGEHKEKCFMCKMYFERGSVNKFVPNHRVLDLQRQWGIRLDGRRYQTSSFLYASSLVCSFCAQIFQDVEEYIRPDATKRLVTSKSLATGFEWTASTDSFSTLMSGAPQSTAMAVGDGGSLLLEDTGAVGEHGFSVASRAGGSVTQLGSLDAASIASSNKLNRSHSEGVIPSSPSRSPSHRSSKKRQQQQQQQQQQQNLKTASTLLNDINSSEESEKLHISTVLQRADVTLQGGLRTYQSSTVDGLEADVAISPPYAKTTRTRREVDPWWEVDLCRRVHINSIALQVLTGHKQKIFVSVLLLSKPQGFEDPFLDGAIKKCVVWKEFVLPENDSPKLETIEWLLPADSFCSVIRVQVRGIHTLSISNFQAFLGDTFLESRDTEAQSTFNSYASMSPAQLKAARELMISPEQKRERLRKAKQEAELGSSKRLSRNELESRLADLSLHIKRRTAYIEAWQLHSQSYAAKMDEAFVLKLFHQVFVPAVKEGLKNGTAKNNVPRYGSLPATSTRQVDSKELASRQKSRERIRPVSAADAAVIAAADTLDLGEEKSTSAPAGGEENSATGSGIFLTGGFDEQASGAAASGQHEPDKDGCDDDASSVGTVFVEEELTFGIADSELEGRALMCHYPRCDYSDLYMRVRGLLLQIQSRNLLKTIGCLGTDPTLAQIADESPDYLGGLSKELKGLEEDWERSMAVSRDKNGQLLRGQADPLENKGLSWSQFVILFHLFMTKQFKRIRSEIFFDEKRHLHQDHRHRHEQQQPEGETEERELTQSQLDLAGGSSFSSPSASARKTGSGGTSAQVMSSTTKPTNSGGGPLLRATKIEAPLLFSVRDPAMPVLDTRYSEYKLSNFVKRVSSEMEFPKKLSLDFTHQLLEFQKNKGRPSAGDSAAATGARGSGSREAGPATELLPAIRGSTAPSASLSPTAATSPAAMPSVLDKLLGKPTQADGDGSGPRTSGESADHIGAPRACALCSFTFPRPATTQQVLWKHILRLRRSWDPEGKLGLIPKDIEMLEQSTSMFNLVHVCGFCHQYFDPDYEGGITFPNRLKNQKKRSEKQVLPAADTPNTDGFFDERYPLRLSSVFADRNLLASRARARFALELLAAKREDTTDE